MRWFMLAGIGLATSSPLAAKETAAPAAAAQRHQEALQAVASIDEQRLASDPAYAGSIADHLLTLQAMPGLDPERRGALGRLAVYALAQAGRHDRAETAADLLLRDYPSDPDSYGFALYAAEKAARWPRAAELVERALARIPAARRADALTSPVTSLMRAMQAANAGPARVRVARALLSAGWPGEDSAPADADWLRMVVVEDAVARGDVAAARRTAAEVQGLWAALELATGRRYDALQGNADRNEAIRAAMTREDRSTAARLAAGPEDTDRIVDRATFLRSVGRDREALDLLLPLMSDVRVVAGRHERGLWLVNEAAYALIATGAAGEAAELMRPLFAMNMDDNPELVNTSINFVSILWQAGQSEEALQRAAAFMAEHAGYASDYGKMWIIANAVCAASDLRRTADSDAWFERTASIADSNRSAMLQALFCRNDLDGAERVLLAAIEDEETRRSAILWLQDYEPQTHADAAERLRGAFRQVRARPAVEAALARHGHRLRLPIPAVRYGWY